MTARHELINNSDVIEVIEALSIKLPKDAYHLAVIQRLSHTVKFLDKLPLKPNSDEFSINRGEERST